MFDRTSGLRLAPSKLHVSMYDKSNKRCTVVPLYSNLKRPNIFASEKQKWAFFGAEPFEFIVQECAEGPLWVHDLSDEGCARRCIAPQAKKEFLDAVAVPGRSAYWVSYSNARELRLFEADRSGAFCVTRKVATEHPVNLRQASWAGERLIWENWRNNVIELVQLEPSEQWRSLLHIGLSGCGCEDIAMSINGRVACAQPCASDVLVGLNVDGDGPAGLSHRELNHSTFWAAPDESSVIVPSKREYYAFSLPHLEQSGPMKEHSLPSWMRAHLAWERSGYLIQAGTLWDPFLKRTVPVVVDANQHGHIDYIHERFLFLKRASLHTYDIAEGEAATIDSTSFDLHRQTVLYDLGFSEARKVRHVPAASFINKGVGLFEEL